MGNTAAGRQVGRPGAGAEAESLPVIHKYEAERTTSTPIYELVVGGGHSFSDLHK